MVSNSHPLLGRIKVLLERRPDYLEGPDAQRWRLASSKEPEATMNELPRGSLAFADNGVGDHLFLRPGIECVMVFRHEGPLVEKYCGTVEELLPDGQRLVSEYSPVNYWGSSQAVLLGDKVQIRLWMFFKRLGRVVYVPGISPRKASMERDGLAWVGIELESGSRVDTIVLPESNELQKSVMFLVRQGG